MEHNLSLSTESRVFGSNKRIVIGREAADDPLLLLGAKYVAAVLKSDLSVVEGEDIKNCEGDTILFCSNPCETAARVIRTLDDFNTLSTEVTPGQPILLSLADDFSEIASTSAASMHRTFIIAKEVGQAQRFLGKAPSLSIVASPHSLNSTVIKEIFELVGFHADNLYQKIPFGILTALNKEELKNLLQRTTSHHPLPKEKVRSVLALAEEDRNLKTTIENTTLLNREEARIGIVKEKLAERTHLFVHYGHGNADALLFSDGAFCSIEEVKEYEHNPSKIPPHCYSNNYECLFCGKVEGIPALLGTVVFSDSCNTIKFQDGFYPMNCNLWQQFIKQGAIAYFSTYKIKHGEVAEAALAFQLLRNGYSLGETAQILNNVLVSAGMDYPSYILLGDPDLRLVEKKPCPQEVSLKDGSLRNVNVGFSEFLLTDVPYFCCNSSPRLALPKVEPRVKDLLFGMVPDFHNNKLRFFLFSFQERIVNEIRLEFGTFLDEFDRTQITQGLKFGRTYETLSIKDRKINFLLQELEALSKNLARRHARLLETETYYLSRKAVEKIYHILGEIENNVLQVMGNKFHFYEDYKYDFFTDSFNFYEVCPYCGSPVFSRTISCVSQLDLRRTIKECLRCGTIYDLSSDGSRNSFVIVGDSAVEMPEFSQTLRFQNLHDARVRVFAAMYIPEPLPQFSITPPFYRENIEAGGERDFVFSFSPKNHEVEERYDLNALVIQDSEIYHSLKLISYSPKRGETNG